MTRRTHDQERIEDTTMSDRIKQQSEAEAQQQDQPQEIADLTAENAEQVQGGKVSMQDIHFTTKVNKASPKLFL
jgi:type VI protein secretion system component Hcp